jgi:thymidine phosphorylase
LRDVTGTVPSIPLIVASILSKKLAEGLNALVLDVKFGRAAFMPTLDKARELAQAMVTLASQCGVNTRALLTPMDAPLGRAAGNWLEVKEAVACLEPHSTPDARPSTLGDLRDLVLACAAHLLVQTGKAKSFEAARQQAAECLASGQPHRKWNDMLVAQGADLDAFGRKLALDHIAHVIVELKALAAGYISHCDARIIGEVIRDLGGGRLTKDSIINHDVGVDRIAKPGDHVAAGAVLARIQAADHLQAEAARSRLARAFELSTEPQPACAFVAEIVSENHPAHLI